MTVKRVGIIGAGPGGLAAIKACLEEGLQPTAFEREEELGGVWVYRDIDKMRYPEAAAMYKCLKTNTSKAFFGFTDFPSPAEWPPFVSHDKVLKYLQKYANHFGLSEHIRLKSEVLKISPVDNYETTGQWRLRYLSSGQEHEDIFDAVIICSGFYAKANLPQYTGLELFEGDICLGNTYRENTKYANKKVLVVGSGISAGDIATDLSNTTLQTYISARHGFNIAPVIDSHGWPFDVHLGRRWIQTLTPPVFERLSSREGNKRFRVDELGLGGYDQIGCQPSSFILNDNFINQVFCGRILPKPKIERFTKNGVVFTDGSKVENLDAVLFCAGYRNTLPFLDEELIPESPAERDLYLHVFPVHLKHQTLACVGFFKVYSIGSPISVIDMQVRWVARVLNEKSVLPSKAAMLEDIRTRRHTEHAQYGKDVFRVYTVPYMDRLANLIGCYPSLAGLFLTDPRLSLHMCFGPVIPASYRLIGPHRWEEAREAILNSGNTTFEGTRSNTAKNEVWGECVYFKIGILLFIVAMITSFFLL